MKVTRTVAGLFVMALMFSMASEGKILKTIDMESAETSGTLGSDDKDQSGNGTFYRSSEQVRSGSHSLMCVLKGRSDTKTRCEETTMDLQENTEYWIGWSI